MNSPLYEQFAIGSIWRDLRSAYLHTQHISTQPNFKTYLFQHEIYTKLHSFAACEFFLFLVRRARKYGFELDDSAVRKLCTKLQRLAHDLPPRVILAFVKTLMNGWATSKRLQQPVCDCIFCGQEACDFLGHMLECPVLVGLAVRFLDIDSSLLPFGALWCAHDTYSFTLQNLPTSINLLKHIYSIYTLYNCNRHTQSHMRTPATDVRTYIRALQRSS